MEGVGSLLLAMSYWRSVGRLKQRKLRDLSTAQWMEPVEFSECLHRDEGTNTFWIILRNMQDFETVAVHMYWFYVLKWSGIKLSILRCWANTKWSVQLLISFHPKGFCYVFGGLTTETQSRHCSIGKWKAVNFVYFLKDYFSKRCCGAFWTEWQKRR